MSQKQHETEEMISLIDFRQASAALFLSVMVTFPCLSDSPVEALLALKHAPENIALEAVVRKSAQLSLEDRGIAVVTLPEDVAAPSPSVAGGILAALASEYLVDFVLVLDYELKGDTIFFDFVWYDAEERASTARQTTSGPIDLTLDRLIDDAVNRILGSAGERIARLQSTAEPVAADEAEAPPAAGVAREVTGSTEDLSAARPDGPAGAIPSPHVFELSTGFSAFLAVGRASDYAKIGYNPLVRISFPFRLPQPGRLSLGLETGANFLKMSGLSLAATTLILPLGVDVGYTYEAGAFFELFARLAGGPAFLVLNLPATAADGLGWEHKMKLLPYLSAGAGAVFGLGRVLGLGIEIAYTLFFEDSLVIMGFAPATKLYLRL